MSGITETDLDDILTFAAKGDVQALHFLHKVADFARRTDDIADGDAGYAPEAVALQFNLVFALMATDPFYDKWRGAFVFLLPVIVLLWSRTDLWKKSAVPNVRITGYVYRESIEFVTFVTAYIVGGAEHALLTMDKVIFTTRARTTETLTDWETE